MQLHDNLPHGWTYEILGTDISTEVLARAEAGRYSQLEVNRGLPAAALVKHFERVGSHWQVSRTCARTSRSGRLNLAAALPALGQFDVIFLRNVLIYFDVATKRAVLERVGSLLKPDGWLFLGSAETTIGIDDRFDRVGHRTHLRLPPAPGGQPETARRRSAWQERDDAMRALVIDDSRAMRLILARIARQLGFDVVEAATARRRSTGWKSSTPSRSWP
jgi:SAM-dependent methyltransferase